MALVLLTNFNIILALILASLLTSKLLSDLFYLCHRNCVFTSEYIEALRFVALTEKKIHQSSSCAEELSYSKTRVYRWTILKSNCKIQ